ncbi:hypothetical protein AWZ03_002316 [Drosophila navojoa]|uniref:Uncharacterized protein n=1 Tax=Drosophila navojoa TaxID=7232 RepID=A0A484BQY5_DRONA|nr:uncharacterized protein LOC108650308 [Drosophila navojoa]TDG51229.1 hypothetical protein AWZ03_002316 [Drosophila navojoa]
MESINFNDFSVKERHEIITAFLIKMRKANSMHSAHSFFQYYLKQFYKMPTKLLDDIIYCQRAMKSYLSVHQTITNVFAVQADADPETKNNYLLEIEDTVHQINAECQYLMIRLEKDIENFCLPFTEQQLQPNSDLISEMVSEAIVPLVCTKSLLPFKPHTVTERPTENQLLRKYFTIDVDKKSSLGAKTEVTKPTKSTTSCRKKNVNAIAAAAPPARVTTAQPARAPPAPTSRATAAPPAVRASAVAPPKSSCKPAAKTTPTEDASKSDAVNASRLHLQAALERARLKKQKVNSETKAQSPKESFLQSFGLCTQLEHKRMLLAQALSHKRVRKPIQN